MQQATMRIWQIDFSADDRNRDESLGNMSIGAFILAERAESQPTTIREVLTAEEELSLEAMTVDAR